MERPGRHWFVFLGLILGGVMLLLGRGLLHRTEDAKVAVPVTQTRPAVRELQIIQRLDGRGTGLYVSMQLDENGIGALPRGLAGSTLEIHNAERQIVVRDWDGQPLDLKFP